MTNTKRRKRRPYQKPNVELGKLIKKHRDALGLSLRAFAEQADVDHCTVYALERGDDVRLSVFLKLAKTHGFPFEL